MTFTSTVSRRSFILTSSLVVAAGASSLTGCSRSGGSGGGDSATLTFWGTYGNGGNSAQTDVLLNELIPAFQKDNPSITIDYVDMPYDGLKQKLTTSSAAGELPDLIRTDIGWNAQFAKLGVLKQLDGAMPGFEELSQAVFSGTLTTTKWNGHYYGLPLDTNTRVLITSQAALDAAGLSTAPATFDEFTAMGSALSGSPFQLYAEGGLEGWNILPWIWSAGGEVTDEDLTAATGHLDSDASVAGVQMLVDLYKEGQIPNLITGNEGATPAGDGLAAGVYATILDGPWARDIWKGQYPEFSPIYAPMPAGDGGSTSVVGGESIVITEATEHVDAAYAFLEFTQSDTFQLGMAKAGQMSVKPSLTEKQVEIDPFYEVFATQLETAKARLTIPKGGEVDVALSEEITKAFNGEATVKEALSAAAARIDTLLSDAHS